MDEKMRASLLMMLIKNYPHLYHSVFGTLAALLQFLRTLISVNQIRHQSYTVCCDNTKKVLVGYLKALAAQVFVESS